MMSSDYFRHMSVEMSLHGKCVVCGKDEDFHIDDNNENERIFKNNATSFCKDCATKLAIKILHGIDF